ncbi:MAG: hypothetical protein GEU71_09110 [Actinobacteria bacterium]|nr:hypothetical protein [Actinomycetota bacterium]
MGSPKLIEPFIARRVARRVAGDPHPGSYLLDRLQRDLEIAVPRAEELVAGITRIRPPAPVEWRLIDRATWAESNIQSMQSMLAPIAEKVGERIEKAALPVRLAQRSLLSVEVGALLGYVSRRVLGQYDLLLGGGSQPGSQNDGVLYFVGPNMVETERHLGFVPEDFALWVAVHEITHRFQFAGVPWLRTRFFSLMHAYLDTVNLDARKLTERLKEGVRRLTDRSIPSEERNPVYLLSSTEQREIMDQIQALMSVVEGHGNFVMDAVGEDVIPSFRRMRHVFEGRRKQSSLAQRAMNHVLGLEMKLRQYEIGREFCDQVAAEGGLDAVARIFEDEDGFPTLEELRSPGEWLRRVA